MAEEAPHRCHHRRRLICIGDIHGNVVELKSLWEVLNLRLGREDVSKATLVFLGDYCDRGPLTKSVLDFLLDLKQSRSLEPHSGGTVFCAGNHDFGMAAYLGCLPAAPIPSPPGELLFDLDSTKPPQYKSGFWPFPVEGGMHYLGRRWGGSSVFEAHKTFQSYGLTMTCNESNREQLMEAVPETHKDFLSNLKWVHDQTLVLTENTNMRVVCVHAGLLPDRSLKEQLDALQRRDLSSQALYEETDKTLERIVSFTGRGSVLPMHPGLQGSILVSGHPGFFKIIDGDRVILDDSGGHTWGGRALQAIVLPERDVFSHNDELPG